jgi:hypothetical protein
MSYFDPIGSRVPLSLRPDGKTDGEHLLEGISTMIKYLRRRVVPIVQRPWRETLHALLSKGR